ncbi:hypothetical protein F5X99DRAFT_367659 [Biscogniauxia marginata]|nr:hypothetical protein F5X99DRAFT_367659 [Biscogniauxia marginata]
MACRRCPYALFLSSCNFPAVWSTFDTNPKMTSQVVYGYPPSLTSQSHGKYVQTQEKVENDLSATMSNMSIMENPPLQTHPSYPQQAPGAIPSPPMSVKSHPGTHQSASPVYNPQRGSAYQTFAGQGPSPTLQSTPQGYPSPAPTPITSPAHSSKSVASPATVSHPPISTPYIPPPPPPPAYGTYPTSPAVPILDQKVSSYSAPVPAVTHIQPRHLVRRPVGQPVLVPAAHAGSRQPLRPHHRVYTPAVYPPAAKSPLPSYNPSSPQPLAFAPPPTEASNPSPVIPKRRSLLLGKNNTSFTAGVVGGLVSTKEFAKDGKEKVGRWSRKTLDSLAGAAGYVPASPSSTSSPTSAPATPSTISTTSSGSSNTVTVSQTTSVVVVPQGTVSGINTGPVGQPVRPAMISNVVGRPPMVAGGGFGPSPGPVVNPIMGPSIIPSVRPGISPGIGPGMGPGIGPGVGLGMIPYNGLAMNPIQPMQPMQRPVGPFGPGFGPGPRPMLPPGQRAGQPPPAADDPVGASARILVSGLTAYNREARQNEGYGEHTGANGEHNGSSGEHTGAGGEHAGAEHMNASGEHQREAYGNEPAMTGEHATGDPSASTMHETSYANGPMDQTYGSSETATYTDTSYSNTATDQTYASGDTSTSYAQPFETGAVDHSYATADTSATATQETYVDNSYAGGETTTAADQTYTSPGEVTSITDTTNTYAAPDTTTTLDQSYNTTTTTAATDYQAENSASYAQYQTNETSGFAAQETAYMDSTTAGAGGYTETTTTAAVYSEEYAYVDSSTGAYVSDTSAYAEVQVDNSNGGAYVIDDSTGGMMYADQQQQVDYGYGYEYDYGGGGVVDAGGYGGEDYGAYDAGAYDTYDAVGGGGGGDYDYSGGGRGYDLGSDSNCLDLI